MNSSSGKHDPSKQQQQQQQQKSPFGNRDFLSLLRSSNGDFGPDQRERERQNDETIRASNTDTHRKTASTLPDLFVPPPFPTTATATMTATTISPQTTTTTITTLPTPPLPQFGPNRSTESMQPQQQTASSVFSALLPRTSLAEYDVAATMTTNVGADLPPRPPPIEARNQSVVFTRTTTPEMDDDSQLLGEEIPDEDQSQHHQPPPKIDPQQGSSETKNVATQHQQQYTTTRTTSNIPFTHTVSVQQQNQLQTQQQQPKYPLSQLKKPESIRNRNRSVSFEAEVVKQIQQKEQQQQQQQQQQAQQAAQLRQRSPLSGPQLRQPSSPASLHQPQSPHIPSNNDIILNHSPNLLGGDASGDCAISFEPNMTITTSNSGSTTNTFATRRKRLQSDNITRALNLEDLLSSSPYELEAETNILKALEEKPSLHRRYRSETSTILSGVPDTMAHDFSLDDGDDVPDPDDGSQDPQSSASQNNSHNNFIDEDQPPLMAADLDLEENMPLIKADKKKKHHRRSMSVEDRLAGLTIEYNNLEDNRSNCSSNQKPNRPTSNLSSGDTFRLNAAAVAGSDANENMSPVPRQRKYTDFSDKLPAVNEIDEDSPQTGDDDTSGPPSPAGSGKYNLNQRRLSLKRKSQITDALKDDLEIWRSFFSPRKENVASYFKFVFIYMGIPLIGIAFVLYYAFDNPPYHTGGSSITGASVSWWLLFCMRQVVTLSLALFLQMIIIDFFSVGTRVMLKIVGPILTLLMVQSRGWPFVFFWWSILDFALLYGDRDVAQHWLFWQRTIGLFNNQNPSGDVVDSHTYFLILILVCVVSVVVAIKRFVVGLWLSRNTFNHYGEQLAKLMNKMVLVSQVAQLAKKIHKSSQSTAVNSFSKLSREASTLALNGTMKRIYNTDEMKDDESTSSSIKSDELSRASPLTKAGTVAFDALNESQKMKIYQLLSEWEEPDRHADEYSNASISAVLKFRNALNLIQNDHAFSLAFGPTHSREACIESSQETYTRLLSATPDESNLRFETLGLIAVDSDGDIDQEKARDLVKIFRPRRDGVLTMLDFVKSTDSVYKEFRLLQASIDNSSQIDIAFEGLLNVLFYGFLAAIILGIMGIDPLSLFLSLSSVILGFAFMIGSASSKYFEGILFILVRRPYGIGDIIHISNVECDTNPNGSIGWIIQKVTLFETVATWVPTLERASFNNGSLANSRIINWRRSPNARVAIQLHFPIETKYEQIEIFKKAVEEYMKVRPREWLQLNGFRVNRIFTEQSYMDVTLLLQHREHWQSIAQVLDSKSNMVTYCSEVQKKLGMQYRAPALPVDLKGAEHLFASENNGHPTEASIVGGIQSDEDNSDAAEARMNYFRLIAKTRHQIRVT